MISKTRKLKAHLKYETGLIRVRMDAAMYRAIENNSTLTADTVFDEAVKLRVPVDEIGRQMPALFKKYRASGLITKLNTYVLSKRKSRPLPVYYSVRHEEILKQGSNKGLPRGFQESVTKEPKSTIKFVKVPDIIGLSNE
jgi:hypothetical protein